MSVTEEDGLTPEHKHPLHAVSRQRLYLYLIPVILFPILLLLAAFLIVPSRWFALHSGNTYMANTGYFAELHNTDCPILIWGDSTAMVGLDPSIIQQRTGLRACNIAEFQGMSSVNGTMFVDEFLAHNPRPRFIVFMYSPEDLRGATSWRDTSPFEALAYRIKHYPNLATARLLATHPVEVLGWAEQGMRMTLLRFHSPTMAPEKLNIRRRNNGLFPTPGDTLTHCDTVSHNDAPDRAWLQSLRTRYATEGTRVIIDATPAPPCEHSLAFIRSHLPPEIDDLPYPTYPVNFFLANTRLHMNAEGSKAVSEMVSDQILHQLGTQGGS